MSGANQHFIPKHVLKGFAIRGRPKFAWEYRAGTAPEEKRLKRLAAACHFYSDPRADGGHTLDDEITNHENTLAQRISTLRNGPPGPVGDAASVAEIVAHLSIRNENVRGGMTYGVKLMLLKIFGLVADEGGMHRLLGLDRREPNQRFKDLVVRPILERPNFRQTGLPETVITRVAFGMVRERLPTAFERHGRILRAMVAHLHDAADGVVRTGHNKLLAKGLVPDARATMLAKLSWSIIETPATFILPDCVAIGIAKSGEARPLFLMETEGLATAIMALSSKQLLVGQAPHAAPFNPLLFNLHAIACSEQFFVSAITSAELTEWSRYIGVRSRTVVYQGLAEAFAEFAPPIVTLRLPSTSTDSDPAPRVKPPSLPSCEIRFLECADQPTAQRIAEATHCVMSAIADTIPLARLDGITFAADYPAALASLDRGFAASGPLTTTDEQDVVAVGMAPLVLRDGVVKAHIVLRGYLGHALISDDEAAQRSALQALVGLFAEVGCVELFDSAVPGVMLKPLENQFDGLRYHYVDRAWSGYFATRASAVLAPEAGEGHRTFLITALRHAAEEIPLRRLEYRFHGDVPRLLDAVLKHVSYVLNHAAHLIGHYDGLEDAAMDGDGVLVAELSKLGLEEWFDLYRRDLRTLWDRRDEWASLDEFLALGHHVERLLWRFGLFLWQTPDGDCRLEVPLSTDEARLREEAHRHPPPGDHDNSTQSATLR